MTEPEVLRAESDRDVGTGVVRLAQAFNGIPLISENGLDGKDYV